MFKKRKCKGGLREVFFTGKVYQQGFGKQAWRLLFPTSVFFPLLSVN